MSVKTVGYIEAAKKKPGLLIHLALFLTMCILNEGVWDSIAEVLPESAKLGHRMIVAESITVVVIIAMAVRGSRNVVRRALQLLVAVTVVTVLNFGIHWFYSRDLAMANLNANAIHEDAAQKSELADKQAGRVNQVLGSLTEFNKSQERLSKADSDLYQRTGQKRIRKTTTAPDLNTLGIIVPASPTPTPVPATVNALSTGGTIKTAPVVDEKPLMPVDVPRKWGPWFLIGGLLALAVTFVGAAAVAAKWEWDWNANGLNDATEGKA